MPRSKRGIFRLMSVIVSLIVIVGCASSALAEYYDEGNDGDSWETAYVISSLEDLLFMASRVNDGTEPAGKYYKLNTDISFVIHYDDNLIPFNNHYYDNFLPIGQYSIKNGDTEASGHYFAGHFDGQNHTVIIDDNCFFSVISTDKDTIAVRNLNLSGTFARVLDYTYTDDSIVGVQTLAWVLRSGIIENCSFRGTIIHSADSAQGVAASGLVSNVYGGTLRNCSVKAEISSTSANTKSYASGIVSSMSGGSIENCIVEAGTSITASGYAGGIVGSMYRGTVKNCTIETGTTITASEYAGGIVGKIRQNCNLSGNTWPSQYSEVGSGDNVVPETDNTPSNENNRELEVAVINIVPTLSDEVVARLARNVSVDQRNIKLLTSTDIDRSTPPEPTEAMRRSVSGKFMAKLNTVNVKEDGWYVFKVTVSDDLKGLPVSYLGLYVAESSDLVEGAVIPELGGVINGLTGMFEISDLLGVELDTLPKQFLVTVFLSASKSLTMYIVKLILLLAGCNAGFGVMGGGALILAVSFIAARRQRKKR